MSSLDSMLSFRTSKITPCTSVKLQGPDPSVFATLIASVCLSHSPVQSAVLSDF